MPSQPIHTRRTPFARLTFQMMALALTFMLLASPVIGRAQTDSPGSANMLDQPSIIVTGQGTATATPDMATFTAGVEESGSDLTSAQDEASRRMNQVLEALRQAGVPDEAIQTSDFRVEVLRSDDAAPQPADSTTASDISVALAATPGPPAPLGFRVINDVRVEVQDISRLGSLLDAVVAAGANRISGVAFSVQDPSNAQRQARQRAVEAARTTAEDLAMAAGVQLGDVLLIVSDNAPSPQPVVAEAQAAGGAVPIAPGQNEVTSTVQVTFALLPGATSAEATPTT